VKSFVRPAPVKHTPRAEMYTQSTRSLIAALRKEEERLGPNTEVVVSGRLILGAVLSLDVYKNISNTLVFFGMLEVWLLYFIGLFDF